MGNLEGIFRGFFLTHRTKAQKLGGKFRSIFRKKIRGLKNIFRAKFTLQTCHLKNYARYTEFICVIDCAKWSKSKIIPQHVFCVTFFLLGGGGV